MAGDGDIRVGSRERDDALAALGTHHEAGRLDSFEYEDRRGRAREAVTRGDLRALFRDLPEPGPRFEADPARRNPPPPTPVSTSRRKLSTTLSALAPLIGIAGLFLTRSWIALLLIPAIAILAKNLDD